jgi:hypothetical protein
MGRSTHCSISFLDDKRYSLFLSFVQLCRVGWMSLAKLFCLVFLISVALDGVALSLALMPWVG